MIKKQYKPGTKAFYDTVFSGLVPCEVTEVKEGKVSAKITKDFKAYRKGEIISSLPHYIVPRSHVVLRGIYYRIQTNFEWTN